MVFFDRSVIKTRWRKFNETPIKKAGLLVRRIAINSIRKGGISKRKAGKRLTSKPGRPPKWWRAGSPPPFHMIYSVPSPFQTSTTVGMVGFTRKSQEPVPGLHELGGTKRIRIKLRVRSRRHFRGKGGKFIPTGTVTGTVAARYPKRPFMRPALRKATPKIPGLWKGSFSK